MSLILPKDNPYLLGHSQAEKLFLDTFKNNALHHAWLITGDKGIGKATFAYKIARFLLSLDDEQKSSAQWDVLPSSSVFKQISNGSHPNFLAVERDYIEADKKKIIKAIKDGEPLDDDSLQDLKKSAVIKVDEIREINSFLSKKSFNGGWRVVLIDSIDELNTAGANALLKILEEPPEKSILLLISHQPSKLLPTITSRCAKLALDRLSPQDVGSLLRRYAPHLTEDEIKDLVTISSGSIGKALNNAFNQGVNLYHRLQNIVYAGTNFDITEALDLAQLASGDEDIWRLILDLLRQLLADMIKSGDNADALYDVYAAVLKTDSEVVGLNMDKKQALINLFYQIATVVSHDC
ncbi:MAG: AAA family ATPase [Alphaproteobacteria bacterium]|nr:AAA family ATPase [Alphaproteobacteria bacterium]